MAYEISDPLLKEIHTRFDYAMNSWREIREAGREDVRYCTTGPWDARERQMRRALSRPCLSFDELNQYLNQLVNNVRMNKRAIKVNPKGNGATDQTAELRGNLIRQIEYRSNAQAAYCTAFENAAMRSYGFARVTKKFVSPMSQNQELCISRIPNPDSILMDPDCKQPDGSDMQFCFVVDYIARNKFKKEYPDATITNFTMEVSQAAPSWIQDDKLQICEYWTIEKKKKTLLTIDDGTPTGKNILKEDLPGREVPRGTVILKERKTEIPSVIQYITNGVEILEKNLWDGMYIPIVPCFGKEVYVDDGTGSQRMIMSLVRLARDPYMLYCYYRTNQAEYAGMMAKTPWVGYEGQFENHEDEWQLVNRSPLAYLEVKATTEATGAQILGHPTPPTLDATPLQIMDQAAESARRAIQAAMGISALPTAAQRHNEKSGIALQRIEAQAEQGSFHFIDNYDRFLQQMGRVLDDLLDKTYDTEREEGIRKPDDSQEVVTVNRSQPDDQGNTNDLAQGDHDVTISTGPSYQSQRDAANDFADNLSQNAQMFPLIGDLVVKLKDLGPIGDEISERLKAMLPPQIQQLEQSKLPPELLQIVGPMQAQLQQTQQALQAATQEIKTRMAEKKMEIDSKERVAAINKQADIAIEAMKLGAQASIDELNRAHELIMQVMGQAHEAGLQASEQGHAQEMADQAAENEPEPEPANA